MAAIELPVVCPAALPLSAVRGEGVEVSGVRCRVVHENIDLRSDPASISGFCMASPATPCPARKGAPIRSTSYTDCDCWQAEKHMLWMGFPSLGDEGALEAMNELTRREDLTGSMYGDTSLHDTVEEAVRESREMMAEARETGGGEFSAEW